MEDKRFTHGSLFSGIGGFDLASEWMGWQNIFHCEWNEFGQKVLKYYWPEAISYNDITKTDFTIHRGKIDILTGGFPCQPYSVAGKRKGKDDERHLWPQMLRAIREIQPGYIVAENVSGLISWNGGLVFHEVQTDLEAEGYEVQPFILPACAKNAPHRRDRVWFIAHANHQRNTTGFGCIQETDGEIPKRNDNAEFSNTGINNNAKNTNSNGRGSIKRKEKSCEWRFGNIGTGNNEQLCPNNEEIGINANSTKCRLEGSRYYRICKEAKQSKFKRFSTTQFITNTGFSKWKNGLHGQEPTRETTKFGNSYTQFGQFTQFPITEPTLRNGNDGLSTRLDGITFSKWRNESIKAGGNAIVPQVAFEIFKAIEKINNLYK